MARINNVARGFWTDRCCDPFIGYLGQIINTHSAGKDPEKLFHQVTLLVFFVFTCMLVGHVLYFWARTSPFSKHGLQRVAAVRGCHQSIGLFCCLLLALKQFFRRRHPTETGVSVLFGSLCETAHAIDMAFPISHSCEVWGHVHRPPAWSTPDLPKMCLCSGGSGRVTNRPKNKIAVGLAP